MGFFHAGEEQQQTPPAASLGLMAVDSDLLELKRGNLLLEREKLNLEIQILQAKMAKMKRGDAVWGQEARSFQSTQTEA